MAEMMGMSTGTTIRPSAGDRAAVRAAGLLLAAAIAWAGPLAGGAATGADTPLNLRLAWQLGLERVCFSPGILDGRPGAKTEVATREFQRVRGLPVTGELDAATAALLGADPQRAVGPYAITAGDVDEVDPPPKGWLAKSQASYLGYASTAEMLGERGHCTRALLAELNGGRDLGRLKAGDVIQLPVVEARPATPRGDRMDVDLVDKIVRVYAGDRLVGLFHCSIAAKREKLPTRSASVAVISENPVYKFSPEMWPEVKGIHQTLLIPPGPRNPVGLCWIGLTLRGVGIHGSPAPEMIGKTGSHGCFRLTNWDALRLAKMVRVGVPVTFSRD
jgi:lipoprotein-anchoring transpeptidase ErfK/SrfK